MIFVFFFEHSRSRVVMLSVGRCFKSFRKVSARNGGTVSINEKPGQERGSASLKNELRAWRDELHESDNFNSADRGERFFVAHNSRRLARTPLKIF